MHDKESIARIILDRHPCTCSRGGGARFGSTKKTVYVYMCTSIHACNLLILMKYYISQIVNIYDSIPPYSIQEGVCHIHPQIKNVF